IRKALTEGNVALAKTYLGYPYTVSGKVVSGKQLGRTIGYPTANVQVVEDYKLIPAIGVYVVGVTVKGRDLYGMLSIGTNPTVGGIEKTIEVNIFDFNDDIYNEEITIHFLTKIRNEENFGSVDLLIEALKKDETYSRNFIKNLEKMWQQALKKIDNSSLIVFRMFFGIVFFAEAVGALALKWVNSNFINTSTEFTFIVFEWLLSIQNETMYVVFGLMGLASLGVIFGFKYRISIIALTFLWSLAYFGQKTSYNNHYYLM